MLTINADIDEGVSNKFTADNNNFPTGKHQQHGGVNIINQSTNVSRMDFSRRGSSGITPGMHGLNS